MASSGADHDVVIEAGESVATGGQVFESLSAYVESDWFRRNGKRCGTIFSDAEKKASRQNATGDCTLALTRIRSVYRLETALTIPVYFHVITRTDGTGDVSDQQINDQITVLNEDFMALAGTMGAAGYNSRIQFRLEGITRTQDNNWFNDNDEYGYKQALGKDQNRYLNVYTNSASGYLGYSYLPQEEAGSVLDGVVLLYESIGGRDNGFSIYNQGRTLVHELGHYFGLFHTFEGYGCDNTYTSGDLIIDTPAESTDHYSCIQTETCSSFDPIHNYMNYTPDTCMEEFTAEQANRMVCSLINYRPDLYSIETIPTLSEWGMIILALSLAFITVKMVRGNVNLSIKS